MLADSENNPPGTGPGLLDTLLAAFIQRPTRDPWMAQRVPTPPLLTTPTLVLRFFRSSPFFCSTIITRESLLRGWIRCSGSAKRERQAPHCLVPL